jgi:hypothetical protein
LNTPASGTKDKPIKRTEETEGKPIKQSMLPTETDATLSSACHLLLLVSSQYYSPTLKKAEILFTENRDFSMLQAPLT